MAFALSIATILIYIMQETQISGAYQSAPKGHSYGTAPKNSIELRAGDDLDLQCGMLDETNELSFISSSNVSWYFKQSTPLAVACNAGTLSCDSSAATSSSRLDGDSGFRDTKFDKNWNLIECDIKPCKPALRLRNVDPERDSGYYKCVIRPYCSDCSRSDTIQFVMTYHVVVLNSTNGPPQILDGLTNKTATLGSTAVFNCNVLSSTHVPIKWLRLVSQPVPQSEMHKYIHYNNLTYELLESGQERSIGDNIYMSKLILTNIAFKDAGFYVCLAVSYFGFQKQEVYLSVVYPEKYLTYHRQEGLSSIIWLLLVPLLFISIPLVGWMCFLVHRNRCRRKELLEVPMKVQNPYIVVNVEII